MQPITTDALGIVGIEVVDSIPEKVRCLAGPYYPDEIEVLKATLRGLRDRSGVLVAPSVHQNAVAIYRSYER